MKTKTITTVLSFFFVLSLTAQKREAHRLSVKNPDKTFIGAVLEHKSINADAHRFVNVTVPEPITISFSLPIKSQTIMPSYDNMMKAVRESVKASGEIKQNLNFSLSFLNVNSYDQLMWYFGQTVNTETFFGIPKNVKPQKTALAVDITQTFFNIEMGFPDDGKLYDKDPEVTKRADELVYIGSLTFGRKVTMLVEADVSSNDLRTAIQEALGNGDKPLSKKSQAILTDANVRAMILGNPVMQELKSDNPFAWVMKYFQKPVTIDDFGVPLEFSAAFVANNGLFNNEY